VGGSEINQHRRNGSHVATADSTQQLHDVVNVVYNTEVDAVCQLYRRGKLRGKLSANGFLEANDLLACFGGVTNFELQPMPLAFNGT